MNDATNTQIKRSIARFRRLSIASSIFIAILTTVMIFKITSALDYTSAKRLNLAAKQRMLSERLLSTALQIDTATRTSSFASLPENYKVLQATVSELQSAHTTLSSQTGIFESGFTQSQTEQDIYRSVDNSFNALSRSAAELDKLTTSTIRRSPYIDEQTAQRITSTKDEIRASHARFTSGMNDVVSYYEQQYSSGIKASIKQAKIGIIILLFVLAINIFFVVEPSILIIRKQVRSLDIATKQARRADIVRWRLLTNMGHEFRTPMNAIMGFANLINEGSLSDEERSRLAISIYESSSHLTHLIETMLDMSAIESGQLRIVTETCQISPLIEQLKSDIASKCNAKGLKLKISIDPLCPQSVTTDAKRLAQILYNLTENAIKFTQEGSIKISASLETDTEKPILIFKVKDTGIGIKPEFHQSIFDPFSQAEDAMTRNYGGVGLGLAVSRDLARAMGGDIVVESTVGQGSTFILTIDPGPPIQNADDISDSTSQQSEPQDQSSPTTTLTPFQSYRVLIVDDSKDNRVLLKHYLKQSGAQIAFANDGQEAIDAVQDAINSNEPFQLLLMDMQMPVLDGYHATVKLRNLGVTVPIIAITAHALAGDREHCLSAGCDEYMTKPVDKQQLMDTCAALLAPGRDAQKAA